MNYEEICSLILELDPKIRGVLIYSHNGEMLAGGMRKGIKSYLPREEITKSTHNAILRWETRKMLFPFLGNGKYSLTEYERVKRITFPLPNSALLMVALEVKVNHDVIIQKILQLIK